MPLWARTPPGRAAGPGRVRGWSTRDRALAWPGLAPLWSPPSPWQEKAELIQLEKERLSFVYSTNTDRMCWIPLRGHHRTKTSSRPGLPNCWTSPQHTNIALKKKFFFFKPESLVLLRSHLLQVPGQGL